MTAFETFTTGGIRKNVLSKQLQSFFKKINGSGTKETFLILLFNYFDYININAFSDMQMGSDQNPQPNLLSASLNAKFENDNM
jgi:hypothetical protein